jgi:hypothetical protein
MTWHRMRRGVGGEPDPREYREKQIKLEEFKRLEDQGKLNLYYLDETGFLSDSLCSLWLARCRKIFND